MRTCPVLLLVGLLLGGTVTADDLPARLARWNHLAAGDGAGRVEGLEIAGERFRLTLESGVLRPVVDGDGTAVGAVFQGRGRLAFGPADDDLERVTRHNAAVLLGRKASDADRIELSFDRLLLLGRGPAVDSLAGIPPVPGLGEKVLRGAVDERLRVYRSIDRSPVEHAVAIAEVDGLDAEILQAVARTGKGDCLLVRDARTGGEESLFLLQHRGKVHHPAELAFHPLGRPARGVPPVPYVVRENEIRIDARELPRLEVKGTLEVVPTASGARCLRFALRNHQADRDLPWDQGRRRIDVVSLDDGAGHPLPFVHRHHELLVSLPEPMVAAKPVRLRFQLDAEIGIQPDGNRYFLLRTLPWYPRSPDDAEAYRMRWEVHTAAPFRPLLSGETRASGRAAGRDFLSTATEMPVRFPVVVAGSFHCIERSGHPRVRVCTYAGPKDRVASAVADYFAASADVLGELLGPFPFAELTVVELPLLDLAQASPGLILLSREILLPNVDPVSRLLGADAPKRMVHELAHSWWGQIVKYIDPGDVWLSESFAEYFAGMALERLAGPEVMDSMRRGWRLQAERGNQAATLYTVHRLSGPDAFASWSDLLYGKGPLLIDAIRGRLGDEAFLRSLRRLLQETRGEFATTSDLARVVQEQTGVSIDDLLERCFYGGEIP